MFFNSFEFLLFLPIVFCLYWFVFNRDLRWQNLLIIAASYIFYGWWDKTFLLLIAFTTLCSYGSGILIEWLRFTPPHNYYAKWVNISNIIINLAILGVYKYFNFFADSLQQAFGAIGVELSSVTLDFVLPVGISFYTFQALSYSIDVYNGKLKATSDIVSFFAYVSFFPQLVAGPIERATNLLPQFEKPRTFEYGKAVDGCRQMLWGFFKKIVVADNCAIYVNDIWSSYEDHTGSTLVLAAVLFAFQIYGDFSGYSDIAIGTSKLFGIDLMRNFNYPYFSRDIAEFWRRWHISLSTWFRDYLYIPLGGSRGGKLISIRNTLIIFVVSGMWHGANWTFIVWGLFHGLLFLPLLLAGKNRNYVSDIIAQDRHLPSFKELFQMTLTFILVVIGWIFFRADNISDALEYMRGIVDVSLFSMPFIAIGLKKTLLCLSILIFVEWFSRKEEFGLDIKNAYLRRYSIVIYYILIGIILQFGVNSQSFIYFQF